MRQFIFTVTILFICSISFAQLSLSSTQQNVTCNGVCDGSATITVTGGTAPYTYAWTPTNITSPNPSGLCAGAYTVTVTDALSITASLIVTITQPPALVSSIGSITNVSCFGACNGSANIMVSGGTGGYTYIWNTVPNQILPTATNLCVGSFNAIVTDANGCVTASSITISQPTQITLNVIKTNASCNGTCNGTATITTMGGTPAYTFTSQPSGITTGVNSNLCAGSYTFTIQDSQACLVTNTFTISPNGGTSLPNATLTTTPYNETCYLTGDGAIDLTITGTNPGPFTYLWSNGATTQDISNVISNTYWVTITDGASNCATLSGTVSSIGVNCGTIYGNVFMDNNSDCIKNIGDVNYQNAMIVLNPGNRCGYSNLNGDYSVNNLPYGTYSVSLNNSNGNIFPSCTTTLVATVNAGTPNSNNNNLSVGFNSVVSPDMHVYGFSNGIAPGFVCYVNYYLKNLNNVSGTGLFKATLPSAFIPNITSASPATYTVSGDTVIWNFNNVIYSGGAKYFYVYFTVPLNTPLGSIFTSCMYAQPNVTDFNYTNNTYCYQRTVTGSYDPNDKAVSPVGVGASGIIASTETDLTYLIRFQNTGNGSAVNIIVRDTLSPNVNMNTFEMLKASHNYNIDILPGNVVRWKFNNIMLPDSNSNEPSSHGFIQYRIKRTANNTLGTQIKNTAYIYFDFNAPIVTNTAINTIGTVTSIKSQSSNENEWNIYPNPSAGILYVVNTSSIKAQSQIQVLNAMGQAVHEETIIGNYKTVDLSKLNNGVYFVTVKITEGTITKRIIINK